MPGQNKITIQNSINDTIMPRIWKTILLFFVILGLAHGSYELVHDKRIENSRLRRAGNDRYVETRHALRPIKSEELSSEARSLGLLDETNNKVSLDEISAKIDSQDKKIMAFRSVAVTVRISPVESPLEESQERINLFERGYLEFLNKLFASASANEYARVNVNSVRIIQSEFDKSSDHTVNVECRIDTKCESSLSSKDLSNLIAEISDKWSSRILEIWTGIEETKLLEIAKNEGIDVAEDSLYFTLLQSATIKPPEPSSDATSEPNNVSHITLFVSVGAVLAALLGMFVARVYIKRRNTGKCNKKREGNFYSVPQDPNINLHELDDVQLTPTRSIFASTLEHIGNISPFQIPNDEALDQNIDKYDQSRRITEKYKAPSRKSGYDRLSAKTKDHEPLRSQCECWAPPGKLGVAIDTVDSQPVVHRIKADSPLKGILEEQDIILAIDDTDTTHMSAADVTYLMVKKMKHERKITFMKSDNDESELNSK